MVEQVLPEVPYRQFVITFPWAMRLALAFQPKFLTQVFRRFVRSLFCWYRLRARRLGIRGGTPGAILLRYGARAPFAASRLSIDDPSQTRQVVYRLARPWGVTGTTVLRLTPRDFLRRLAMLIPPPYQNLIRHYGVFASRSKLRPRLPPPPATPLDPPKPAASEDARDGPGSDQDNIEDELDSSPPPPKRTYRLPWAKLMKRVMGLDPLICKRCSTPMVILAFISNLDVVRKILSHLKIPTDIIPAPLADGP